MARYERLINADATFAAVTALEFVGAVQVQLAELRNVRLRSSHFHVATAVRAVEPEPTELNYFFFIRFSHFAPLCRTGRGLDR